MSISLFTLLNDHNYTFFFSAFFVIGPIIQNKQFFLYVQHVYLLLILS